MRLRAGQFQTVADVGLMIGRANATQNHIGILYMSDEGPRFVHLAWHYRFCVDDPTSDDFQNYLWADLQIEDEENRTVAAAFVDVAAKHAPTIPYGFSFTGSAFNPDGSFVHPPFGQGLTCATFVLQILSGAGFQLIELKGWQSREGDEEWRQKIIGHLERREDVAPAHIEKLREDTTAIRIRPEDVLGANFSSPWPVMFADASRVAGEVLAELCDRIPMH